MAVSKVDAANQIENTLPVAQGGTGLTSDFKNGITVAQQFRLSGSVNGNNTIGTVFTAWEETDTDYQAIGSAWSESSGIFSTTQTGIYMCHWTVTVSNTTTNDAFDANIQISTDSGSSYNMRSLVWTIVRQDASMQNATSSNSFIFDVADASTFRLRMRQSDTNSAATGTTFQGATNYSATQMTFIRLGDT